LFPLPHPPIPTLFPYTTLFRSHPRAHSPDRGQGPPQDAAPDAHSPAPGFSRNRGRGVEEVGAALRRLLRFMAPTRPPGSLNRVRSEEHTSELQSRFDLVCRLLL